MIGAIIGDIVGSRFEWHNIKTKKFDFFSESCKFTDDSVLTIAVGAALSICEGNYNYLCDNTINAMHKIGGQYMNCGFGGKFKHWLYCKDIYPYNSFGNGSAMRVSCVGFVANSIDEVKRLSYDVTRVTHNHYEGIKGAEATAMCIYLARQGKSKEEIKEYVQQQYYNLNFTLNEIRPNYKFDVTCQGSVPQAIVAFLESDSFEDAIRNAISIGGDSDTVAAITGGIAEAYYGVPEEMWNEAKTYLDDNLLHIMSKIENTFGDSLNNIIKKENE